MTLHRLLPASLVLAAAALLAGCSMQGLFDKAAATPEAAMAETILGEMAARRFDDIERQSDPRIQGPEARTAMETMAGMFPAPHPDSRHLVGYQSVSMNGVATYNVAYEYGYPGQWLLAAVALRRESDRLVLLGVKLTPLREPLEVTNRFTLQGKGPLHIVVLAMAVIVPLFIVAVFVLCLRTPIAGRKWLWLLFIAVGVSRFWLNWTDGTWGIQPVAVSLLGAGAVTTSPYAPWTVTFGLPLGAIVFLVRRRALAVSASSSTAPSP